MPLSSLYTSWEHAETWGNKGSTFWLDENLVRDISDQHKIQWGCISFGIVCGNDMVDFIISTTAYALLSWEQYIVLPTVHAVCWPAQLLFRLISLAVREACLFSLHQLVPWYHILLLHSNPTQVIIISICIYSCIYSSFNCLIILALCFCHQTLQHHTHKVCHIYMTNFIWPTYDK